MRWTPSRAAAPPRDLALEPTLLKNWRRIFDTFGGAATASSQHFRDYEFAERYLRGTALFPEDGASRWFTPAPFHTENSDLADQAARLIIRRYRESAKCLSRAYYETVRDRLEASVTPDGRIVEDEYLVTESPRESVYAVRTRSGREIVVNAAHPFLTWGGEWQTVAGGLKVGDWVGVARRGVFGTVPAWLTAEQRPTGPKSATRLRATPALAQLVGWILADGNETGSVVACDDPDERKDLLAIAAESGLAATETERSVRVRGLRAFWRAWGLFGSRAADKFVPAWILRGDRATVAACLRGLFKDASQQRDRRGVYVYTSTSRRLADDVQHLLVKFGLYARLASRLGEYHGRPYPYWQVTVTDTLGVLGEPARLDAHSVSDRFPPEWRSLLSADDLRRCLEAGINLSSGDDARRYATTRARVRRVAHLLGRQDLLDLCESHIGWEPIVAIESRGDDAIASIQSGQETLTVGDLVTHNSTQFTLIRPLRLICENRNIRIIIVSKTLAVAERFVRTIGQQLATNERLVQRFGTFRDRDAAWSGTQLTVVRSAAFKEPSLQAVGRGGQIVSGRYEMVILDDVEDYESTRTDERRLATYEWFKQDVLPVIVTGGQALIIQTPQHEGDLVGQLTRAGIWELVTVPAEVDAPEAPGPIKRVAAWPAKWPIYWQSTVLGTPCRVEQAESRRQSSDTLAQVASVACKTCFDGRTSVETDQGVLPIRKIVTERMRVSIRAFDRETGRVRWGRVVDWQVVSSTDWLTISYFAKGRSRRLKVTRDHHLWDGSKMVAAETLRPGDALWTESPMLSPEQHQVLLGSLLGDGSVSQQGAGAPRFSEVHAINQREYLRWKSRALSTLEPRESERSGDDHRQDQVGFYTSCLETLRPYYDLCYPGGRRTLSWPWLSNLGALGLATWVMDNGSFQRNRQGSHWCALSAEIGLFPGTHQEIALVWRYFAERWGLHPRLVPASSSRGWRAKFSVSETSRLLAILEPYLMVERQERGQPDSARNMKRWVAQDLVIQDAAGLVPVPIRAISSETFPRGKQAYDVTVEPTHTILANGVASSNCPVYNPRAGDARGVACLTGKRFEVGEVFYNLQYRCSLTALGGSIFKRGWFRYYLRRDLEWRDGRWLYHAPELVQPAPLTIRIGIDPAVSDEHAKQPDTHSKFGLVVLGYCHPLRRRLILSYINQHLTWPQQEEVALEAITTWSPHEIVVEAIAYQKALKQALAARHYPVSGVTQDTDKFRRFAVLAPEFRVGNVYVLGEEREPGGPVVQSTTVEDFVHQFAVFDKGTFTDLLDAYELAQRGLADLDQAGAFAEYARRDAVRTDAADSPHVIPGPAAPPAWTTRDILAAGRLGITPAQGDPRLQF